MTSELEQAVEVVRKVLRYGPSVHPDRKPLDFIEAMCRAVVEDRDRLQITAIKIRGMVTSDLAIPSGVWVPFAVNPKKENHNDK